MLALLFAPFRVVGALITFFFVFLKYVFILVAGSISMVTVITLLTVYGIVTMPLYPASNIILNNINTGSEKITSNVQPIVDDVAQGIKCTKNPTDNVYNQIARVVITLVRFVMDILANSPFNLPIPDVFGWATYGLAIDPHLHEFSALRIELNRIRNISQTPYENEWMRVSDMNRFAIHRQTAIIDEYCTLTESLGEFAVTLLDIYMEFEIGLFEVIGGEAEAFRLLKPGAWFDVCEICRTGEGELAFPLPWASTPAISHVVDLEAYERSRGLR